MVLKGMTPHKRRLPAFLGSGLNDARPHRKPNASAIKIGLPNGLSVPSPTTALVQVAAGHPIFVVG
jgi:hypothetical protein